MKNHTLIIGIDVSKNKLDIVAITRDHEIVIDHQIVDNTNKGIKTFIDKIVKQYSRQNILVVFENTGIYSMPLAYCLSKKEIDYSQLNALEIYRSQGIKRGKSDKLDAMMIARYTLVNSFKIKLSQITPDKLTELKLLHTQREKILKDIKKYRCNKEYDTFLPNQLIKRLTKTNRSILNNLKKNLKVIEAQIIEVIQSEISLKQNYTLVQSIPGIGPQTALYLLIVTKGFTTFNNARQLACYGGIAPFPYQSGSSIKGKNKVNHLADKKLKSLLNMCALNAKKKDKELALYFERKLKEGKNKMLILNNIRNKLLNRVFAVIKRQQPYVDTHKFAA